MTKTPSPTDLPELVVVADETLTGRADAQGLVSRMVRDGRKTGLPPEFDPYLNPKETDR